MCQNVCQNVCQNCFAYFYIKKSKVHQINDNDILLKFLHKTKLNIGQYYDLKKYINQNVICANNELIILLEDIHNTGIELNDEKRWHLIALIINQTKLTNKSVSIKI